MRIDYNEATGGYMMKHGNSVASASSRMLLVKLACGIIDDDETHEDEVDLPDDLDDTDPSDVY